jgi:hypothetical protein
MHIDMNNNLTLTCNMNVFTPAERDAHFQVMHGLTQKIESVRQIDNGYEFGLPNQTEIITRIAQFIAKERLCCPFLDFTLTVQSNNGPVSLRLTGPAGIHEYLRAEFDEALALL